MKTIRKKVRDLKAGDRTKWYEVLSDAKRSAGMPPLLECEVRYNDGAWGARGWPLEVADTREVEIIVEEDD